MIEKLGGIDPIKNLQNTQKPRRMEKVEVSDSVQVSPEAQKLEEVIKKFQDPSYIDSVLDQTTDKILDSLGF